MAVPKKVINFLEKAKVQYSLIEHKTVYTAFDKAKTLKAKQNIIGKTLVLKADKELIMVLIPANKNLDKNKLKKVINTWKKKTDQKLIKKIDFTTERLIKNRIKGVKLGSTPPFGNLFKMPFFVNKSLFNLFKIIVNSGDYNSSIEIKASLLKKLTPDLIVGSFAKPRK